MDIKATSMASNNYKRPQSSLKWTFTVAIVISGMFFNGVIYGYTSPALPSFYENEQDLDTLLPK